MIRFLLVLTALLVLGGSAKIQEPANTAQASANSASNEDNDTSSLFSPVWSSENKVVGRDFGVPPTLSPYSEFYPCDVGLQAVSWNDVSIEERMLAFGYQILDDQGNLLDKRKSVEPLVLVGNLLMNYYEQNGQLPDSSEALYDWSINRWQGFYEDGYTDKKPEEYAAELAEKLTSPVTGKLIEWNHQEFSRGNAFVTIVNANSDALEFARSDYLSHWHERTAEERARAPGPDRIEDAVFVLYRAYGEEGVLREFGSTSFSKQVESNE